MPTLSDVAATIAGQIIRGDLDAEIKAEIANAIRVLNAKPLGFSELLDGTITTISGTVFYDQVDFSAAAGSPLTKSATTPVSDIISVDHMSVVESSQRWEIDKISFREFERRREGVSTSTVPTDYVRYADRIGFWPTPGGVYTVYVSGRVKARVPTDDAHTSIWFDRAPELVEDMAAARVLRKHVHDYDKASARMASAQEAMDALNLEYVRQRTTGRVTPTRF